MDMTKKNPVRRQGLAEKEEGLFLSLLRLLLLRFFSRSVVCLLFLGHLREFGGHKLYSVVVNIVLIGPFLWLEVALDRDALSFREEVESVGCFVALPCLDIEDSRYLFLLVAVLLCTSY